MMEADFRVKFDRREGALEVSGPDGDWVERQIERLAPVLETTPNTQETAPRDGATVVEDQAGNSEAKKIRRRGAGRGAQRARKNQQLEQLLTRDVRGQLQEYADARTDNFSKHSDQAAIIATFLMDELKWESVSSDDMYTVYSVMGWPTPGNPKAQLDNAAARAGYFGSWHEGKIQLTHAGENFGRHKSLEGKKASSKVSSAA